MNVSITIDDITLERIKDYQKFLRKDQTELINTLLTKQLNEMDRQLTAMAGTNN